MMRRPATKEFKMKCYIDHLHAQRGASSGPWKHPAPQPRASAWLPLCIIGGAFAWAGIILALWF